MEDFASAISDLLKKWMGDNGWRFWLCAFIVLSIMWYVERNNYCGYGALFSLLMTTLLLIGYIRDVFINRRRTKINRLVAQCDEDNRRSAEESRIFDYKNKIWKVFAVANEEAINSAIAILSLKEIDKNPFVRFASREDISNNPNLRWNIEKARQTFIISTNDGASYDMINLEINHLGYYLEFDEYLYALLINYKENHERKFI